MYISEIDDILNETLNNFMGVWILENKNSQLLEFKKIIKEVNFIKYQKQINDILEFAESIIPNDKINKFVTKKQNVILINSIIIKFLCYYLFIMIGINYAGKIELFNNNLIEFSRNQVNFKVKVDNFFNTESNSIIIKTINLINEFLDYLHKLKSKKESVNLLDNYSYLLKEFIDKIGEENIKKNIVDKLLDEKKKIIIDHSITIMMIQLIIFKDKEKHEIFEIIENTETSNGDFMFIDVVVPRSDYIDYNDIESILSPDDLKTNLPDKIFNLINEDYTEDINEKRKYFTDHDIKIQKLLDTHILIPIVDDFLLYHKDNEKYEKQGDKVESPKKKDETKIKYIINKINTVSELYKNPSEIKKLFYVPLQDSNAILINTYEDIKIISKHKNIIKMNSENLDLINDLLTYRAYPYISFKDFKNNGFIFSSNKTIDVIRNSSVSLLNKRKFDVLQTRIMSDDMLVNIIGFAIINKKELNELNCLNLNTFINITNETDEPLDSIKTLINYKIKQKILSKEKTKNESLDNNYFWLFDLSKQKYNIPFYDISDSMPKNEVVKIITSYLYDYLIETVIDVIKQDINTSHPKLITTYIDNLEKYKHIYPEITYPQHSKELNELQYLIYYVKSIKISDTYDYNEDEFPGLYGDVKKLPNAPKKKYPPIPVLSVTPDFENKDFINEATSLIKEGEIEQEDYDIKDKEYINGICQHNISWDKIGELQKNNNIKYSDLVYEFIQQYVDVSTNLDYICKSCKAPINVKKYIQDGQFDTNTNFFVTFSIQMDINIEELPEYEKYKTSIRNIDKIIERMASIFNLHGLKGSTTQIRSRRRNLVKDVIDVVLVQYNYLKKEYQSKRDDYIKKFGINKASSIFFIFELKNDIFIYSSKDKDYYKIIKYNNVLCYILLNIIFELNDTQIQVLTNNKFCSYQIFKKIGFSLFDNLKIIINKTGDYVSIKEYPILCYIIYLTSCLITQYNIWIDLSSEVKTSDKNKFNAHKVILQKSIINTFVEIFNTILLVDSDEMKKNKYYIYEVLQTKYYFKLDLFKDTELIRKLDKMYLQIISNKEDKKLLLDSIKYDLIPNNNIFNNFYFDDLYNKFNKKFSLQKFVTKYHSKYIVEIDQISNLTNCIDGPFHNFQHNGTTFICTRCKEEANLSNLITDSIKLLYQRQIILYMRKLATKYCINGDIHQFDYDAKKDISICSKCKYNFGSSILNTDKELFKMFDIIEKNKNQINNEIAEYVKDLKTINSNEINKIKKIFDKIMYKFQKYDNDINKSINIILDNIQKLLGIDIIINNKVYNLHYNIYYIDHDYNGTKLDTPIQIYEKENKFRVIENHPYFKRNILVYTMQRNTKYELFYDFLEKNLLGYREVNKEYIDLKKNNCKLQINYSIKNMLLLFGLTRQQINIKDMYPQMYGMTEQDINDKFVNNKYFSMKDFVDKICIRRFEIIKKLGLELNKYINRFKYKYKINLDIIEYINPNNNQLVSYPDPSNNPIDILYNKYQKKIDSDIKTEITDKNNTHTFLKYINDIITYLPFSIKINKNNELKFSNYIDYNYIIKNDTISNFVLNYILDEFIRLLNYNTNKANKTNIAHFIIDIICILFNTYNYEVYYHNKEFNHYHQTRYASEFYIETQNVDILLDAIDYYEQVNAENEFNKLSEDEQKKRRDELYDDYEETQGYDMGDEILDEEGRFDIYSNYQFRDNIQKMIKENSLPPGEYYY